MITIISDLIKQWGVKKVLGGMIEVLRNSSNSADRQLASELKEALDRYSKKVG